MGLRNKITETETLVKFAQNIMCYTPGRKPDWAHSILFLSPPWEELLPLGNPPETQRADYKPTITGTKRRMLNYRNWDVGKICTKYCVTHLDECLIDHTVDYFSPLHDEC